MRSQVVHRFWRLTPAALALAMAPRAAEAAAQLLIVPQIAGEMFCDDAADGTTITVEETAAL